MAGRNRIGARKMLSSSSWIRQRVHAARRPDYDTTICGALPGAFGSRTTFSIIEKYESVQISVNGSTTILDDGISSTAKSAGQSSKKVSLNKLQFNTALQEAAKNAAQKFVAALAKNGWQKS